MGTRLGLRLTTRDSDILAAESDSVHRAGKIFATRIDPKKNEIYYLF